MVWFSSTQLHGYGRFLLEPKCSHGLVFLGAPYLLVGRWWQDMIFGRRWSIKGVTRQLRRGTLNWRGCSHFIFYFEGSPKQRWDEKALLSLLLLGWLRVMYIHELTILLKICLIIFSVFINSLYISKVNIAFILTKVAHIKECMYRLMCNFRWLRVSFWIRQLQ